MAGLNSTPRGDRLRIVFTGLRNAGKSTLANEFTGQNLSIVSDTPGTTTDPVAKSMEILPLGPCTVVDTAGLDDEGDLGAMRAAKTLEALKAADVAVWVAAGEEAAEKATAQYALVAGECARRGIKLLYHARGDGAAALKERIAALDIADGQRPLLEGLAGKGARIVCVCPIDESAPKGRLILPQVQTIRECLDAGATCIVCVPETLGAALAQTGAGGTLVITDSQAFAQVRRAVAGTGARLTSFSILFARRKGDFAAYLEGLAAIARLRDGDRILVAEGCTHKRQCGDIGSVKIPAALRRMTGKRLEFDFASGGTFGAARGGYALAVQCGGCMLTRREVLSRIDECRRAGIPVVNYGMLLFAASGGGRVNPDGTVEK